MKYCSKYLHSFYYVTDLLRRMRFGFTVCVVCINFWGHVALHLKQPGAAEVVTAYLRLSVYTDRGAKGNTAGDLEVPNVGRALYRASHKKFSA